MDWGKSITLVIIAFIAIMMGLVYVASKQSNEMIDTNYYAKELKYQHLIDAAQNLNKHTKESMLVISNTVIGVRMPLSLFDTNTKGRVDFLKADNQSHDKRFDLQPDASGLSILPIGALASGSYLVRISWTHHEVPYYKEEKITIH